MSYPNPLLKLLDASMQLDAAVANASAQVKRCADEVRDAAAEVEVSFRHATHRPSRCLRCDAPVAAHPGCGHILLSGLRHASKPWRGLHTQDLIKALEMFPGRYTCISVFADDLAVEAALDIEREAWTYGNYVVIPDCGVVRLVLGAPPCPTRRLLPVAVDAAIRRRGEGLVHEHGPVLGLLIRGQTNFIHAMEFDVATSQWRSYGGGLLRWMKQCLGVET